jgi:xanthine dehydrogenase accessory factor
MSQQIIALQLDLRQRRQPHAVATVVEVLGSSSAKTSAKAVFDEDGKLVAGWVGGGCAQSMVAEAALQCLLSGSTCLVEVDLTDEVFGAGMPCGGHMRVYVEPVLPNPRLWLLGHGLIVEALCEFASRVGYDVVVNDSQAKAERFPRAVDLITDDIRYGRLSPDPVDSVVVATHHKGDYDALTQALKSDARYIAMIASRTRAVTVKNRLHQEGYSNAQLSRIRTPAGLNLAARMPEEIALAIAAEMVMVRRGGNGQALVASEPPIAPPTPDVTAPSPR